MAGTTRLELATFCAAGRRAHLTVGLAEHSGANQMGKCAVASTTSTRDFRFTYPGFGRERMPYPNSVNCLTPKSFGSPGRIRTSHISGNSRTTDQNLSELVLIEGIQQIAMERDESISPALFTFRFYGQTTNGWQVSEIARSGP